MAPGGDRAGHGRLPGGDQSACRDPGQADVLAQHFTGVHPDHRGLGIALALKCLVTRYAQQNGYRRVTTATQETNAAMLAVNRRLGFRVAYSHLRRERFPGHSRRTADV
ncbi:GNAT family N-acetyltransferase [Symbiobacterium thermophilum]|uniref:GNAT family N-acetyltransferase n=1 Tax=Symbiobacterium thermophilum TaxID=2734 RepID=UPI0035C73B78